MLDFNLLEYIAVLVENRTAIDIGFVVGSAFENKAGYVGRVKD